AAWQESPAVTSRLRRNGLPVEGWRPGYSSKSSSRDIRVPGYVVESPTRFASAVPLRHSGLHELVWRPDCSSPPAFPCPPFLQSAAELQTLGVPAFPPRSSSR